MSHEQPDEPVIPSLREVFGITECEDLYNRVTDRRFEEILADERITIHEISEDYNNYGEFLFVHVSRPAGDRRISVCFYGIGFHEHRERWYTDQWFWYRANNFPERLNQTIPKDEAEEMIKKRRAEIASYVTDQPRSPRARLFEFLADITDEDGALAELEDLGDEADWLFDEPDT